MSRIFLRTGSSLDVNQLQPLPFGRFDSDEKTTSLRRVVLQGVSRGGRCSRGDAAAGSWDVGIQVQPLL